MSSQPTAHTASSADTVVHNEVKVCQKSNHTLSPAAREMAEEMYKNVTMGADAYLHMLPHVEDERIKTDITAAMCYYEKLTGKVKTILTEAGIEPKESNVMAKMSAQAGIFFNTAMDKTNSHITEMLIEGSTMSITTAEKLCNHAEGKEDCAELAKLCRDWSKFEQNHIDALKKYL